MDSTTASALLDNGAWILHRSVCAREWADALQHEARELVLTFRTHRFRPILGASEADGREDVRRTLGAFAACRPIKTYVGESRGSVCDACGSRILVGNLEWDVVATTMELRLDAACYLLLVDELERLKPEA